MSIRSGPRRLVLPVLLTAMLALVVAAAVTPNTGVVSAQSNCQYTSCAQGQELTVPLDYVLIGIIIVESGLLIAVTVLLSRRRSAAPEVPPVGPVQGPPPAGGAPPETKT